MRKSIAFLIAAAAVAVPASAQNTTDPAADTVVANDPAAVPVTDDPANTAVTDPALIDPLANDPGVSPEVAAVDTAEPAPARKSGFPWGVLGLLGLLGLIPRKPRDRRHDGAI